ncbi:hypothetical protein V8C35DRAFT_143243 [Trichoderma chlorosporum]
MDVDLYIKQVSVRCSWYFNLLLQALSDSFFYTIAYLTLYNTDIPSYHSYHSQAESKASSCAPKESPKETHIKMSSSGSLTPITSVDSVVSPFDRVTPTTDQAVSAFDFSKNLWQSLLTEAGSMTLNRNTINLASLAKYGPKLPDVMEGTTELAGYAKWHKAGESEPAIPSAADGVRHGLKRTWDLMKLKPTPCEISKRSGFKFADSESNGVAFMFLAWSYIISAFLLEQQQIPIVYEGPYKQWGDGTYEGGAFFIDLGDASDEEYRWWSALVHPGQGWKAAYSSQPVWAVTLGDQFKFIILNERNVLPSSNVNPPSSQEALAFLTRFAVRFNLENQASLGLAMALTIPLHDNMSSTIQLPEPYLTKKHGVAVFASVIEQEFRNLSYYAVLSSNPIFIASALWSVFWEPGIDCNLASPWCSAIIDVIKPLIEDHKLETLGHVLAQRRPGVAALWYGLVACGTTDIILSIIPYLETLHTAVPARHVPEVSAWTNTPQSFMDLAGSGPYLRGKQVSREDLWRLRHESWNAWKGGIHFRHLPTTPFRPFGSVDAEEVEVMLRPHLAGPRREWVYSGFTWTLDNGIDLTHEPRVLPTSWAQFEAESHFDLLPARTGESNISMDYTASKRATGDVFRWAATEMEGTGRHIYSHPWVNVDAHLASVEQENRRPEGVVRVSDMDRVKEWVVSSEGYGEGITGAEPEIEV